MAAVTFKTQMFILCGTDIVFITSSGCLFTPSIKSLFLLLLYKLSRKQIDPTNNLLFFKFSMNIALVFFVTFCKPCVSRGFYWQNEKSYMSHIFVSQSSNGCFSWRESRHFVHFLTLHCIYKLLYSLTSLQTHTLTNAQCKWVPGSTSPLIVVLAKALTNRDGGCQDAPCPSSRHSIWRQLIEDAASGSTVVATWVEQLTGCCAPPNARSGHLTLGKLTNACP